jgi:hypothetical protein
MVPDVPRSTLYFLVLFVGASVMFAGIGSWFAMSDKDYHFSFSETVEDPPRQESIEYYEELSEEERGIFHAAVDDGESFSFEEREEIPGAVIRYEGTYYVFDTYGYFDWLNPSTGGPALLGFLGLVIMADAARRDIKYG